MNMECGGRQNLALGTGNGKVGILYNAPSLEAAAPHCLSYSRKSFPSAMGDGGVGIICQRLAQGHQ